MIVSTVFSGYCATADGQETSISLTSICFWKVKEGGGETRNNHPQSQEKNNNRDNGGRSHRAEPTMAGSSADSQATVWGPFLFFLFFFFLCRCPVVVDLLYCHADYLNQLPPSSTVFFFSFSLSRQRFYFYFFTHTVRHTRGVAFPPSVNYWILNLFRDPNDDTAFYYYYYYYYLLPIFSQISWDNQQQQHKQQLKKELKEVWKQMKKSWENVKKKK